MWWKKDKRRQLKWEFKRKKKQAYSSTHTHSHSFALRIKTKWNRHVFSFVFSLLWDCASCTHVSCTHVSIVVIVNRMSVCRFQWIWNTCDIFSTLSFCRLIFYLFPSSIFCFNVKAAMNTEKSRRTSVNCKLFLCYKFKSFLNDS